MYREVFLVSSICILILLLTSSVDSDIRKEHVNDLILPPEQLTSMSNVSGPGVRNASIRISRKPIVIVISFDGFRYDYFSKVDTPNLDWVKRHGLSTPYMKPQFPTKTFPNHHSLATGLHPETHGVIDNTLYDPLYNKTLGVKNETFYVYNSEVVPLWVLNEWAGGVSGAMMWPGSLFGYGHNSTKASYIVDHNINITFESRVDTVVQWITDNSRPANLIYAYFEQPDSQAHVFGPDSNEVKHFITRMDNVVGYLIYQLTKLNILDQVNLVFLSDHGFEPVTINHIINISTLVESSRYQFFGGSPVYSIYPTQANDLDSLYADLKNASIGLNFSVFRKEDIQILKPNWFYSHSRRISPIVLVADLGYVFDDFYVKVKNYAEKYNITDPNHTYGTHGYDNEQKQMGAFFRASGPAFAPGRELEPFENIDLFPLLCEILQIPTPPNNGSLQNVLKAFRLLHDSAPQSHTVAWVAITGVVLGVGILIVITAAIFRKGSKRSSYTNTDNQPRVGYRFHPERSEGQVTNVVDNLNNNGVSMSVINTHDSSCPESRALLSLSDESLPSSSAGDQVV